MEQPRFLSGDFDTRFIDQEFSPERLQAKDEDLERAAALVVALAEQRRSLAPAGSPASAPSTDGASHWRRAGRERQLR